MTNTGAGKKAANQAEQVGHDVQDSKAFRALVTVGLISYGVVHLLVAWIAVQIAWFGESQQASQKGAFQEMASTSVGRVLLWITAVGLFALAVWQFFEAAWGHRDAENDRKRVIKRLGSAGKTVLYAVLGVSAITTAAGSGSSGDGQKTMTASLMGSSFGRILVALIGVAVVVAGVRLVVRGVKRKFVKDLAGGAEPGIIRLGQIGYTAKGVALSIVGILFVVAAVTYNPDKAGGLDEALRTLGSQPYGSVLLTLMALGIAAFGLYCFGWSRHAKQT